MPVAGAGLDIADADGGEVPAEDVGLVAAGIVGFWNFSSFDFAYHYEGIATVNVHLGDSLLTLSYLMTHMDEEGKQPTTLR